MAFESVLESVDFTDNYIAEPSQIQVLQGFRFLTSVSFRKKEDFQKGANPICDLSNYEQVVR
jgi:hypothetical protein